VSVLREKRYTRPSLPHYRFAQVVCGLVAGVVFRRKILRNEIRGKKGPFVVLANHQAMLDFVTLIGASARPMSFVISQSFFSSLPIKGYLHKMGVIPKQQFQTSANDLKKIKAVVDAGEPLVIYPAGLMCEDGLSTPIPSATYKLLKWLKADVYVAKVKGTYFVMPKWTKGMRPGRTYLDIYKLFSAEELAELPPEEVRRRTDEALLFDAYREQEELRVRYCGNSNVAGLDNVLYQCPLCGAEFAMEAQDSHTLRCIQCGYAQKMDELAFFHNAGHGEELRYVSDWSRLIHERLKERILRGETRTLSAGTGIHMVDPKKNKFAPVGDGTLSLTETAFRLEGTIHGQPVTVEVPSGDLPTLPFSPGRHLELQDGNTIYRCVLTDGRLAMKFIHMLKIFHEIKTT